MARRRCRTSAGTASTSSSRATRCFAGIEPGTAFYFVHSYVVAPRDPAIVLAESEHGSRFPAAIAAGNLLGVQFHPERSGPDGLRLLANFVAIAAASAAGVSQGAGARAEVPA